MTDDAMDDGLLLDNQLCHALHHTARKISKVYVETLHTAGLTYPQYLVLITLLQSDELSVGEICSLLHLDSGTITPLLKRMEANNHLVRSRKKGDERVVIVRLTEQGRALQGIALDARNEVVRRLGMSNEEIMQLRGQLMDLAERLDG